MNSDKHTNVIFIISKQISHESDCFSKFMNAWSTHYRNTNAPTYRISLILGRIRVQKIRKCRLKLLEYLHCRTSRIHFVFVERLPATPFRGKQFVFKQTHQSLFVERFIRSFPYS